MRLTIDVAGAGGIPVLDRNLARFQARLTDVRPAFQEMATVIASAEAEQFDSEGGKASGGWPALNPDYAAAKQVLYPGTKILERTGELMRSLTRRPFGVEHISVLAMEVGTAVPYAIYHQQGGRRLPKRPPVGLTEETKQEIAKILQRYVVTGLGI